MSGQSGRYSLSISRVILSSIFMLLICVSSLAGTQTSKLYYIYITACESCYEVSSLINMLPNVVQVVEDGAEFSSPVDVVRINLTSEPDRAIMLFDIYQVPQKDRIAPIVLTGDTYYAGTEKIRQLLSEGLSEGVALNTLEETHESSTPNLLWKPMLAAGFIGGLNPCALSMLLLLLAVLANIKANAAKCAAVFLGAKFVTYLLIGTVLLGLFQTWNPSWLQLVTKIALTVLSAVLIALNLWDARMAQKECYGEIKNQLPVLLRRSLQTRIILALEKPFAPLTFVVAALGVLVAAGEFLCAGQVYLASLLAAIQTGSNLGRLLPMLVGYCLMFLAPSILVSISVARGQALFTVSEFVRRRMSLIKLITALLFIAILVYVWMS